MKAKTLFDEGRVLDAIQELGAQLRANPTDVAARRFLIDLLGCSGRIRARAQACGHPRDRWPRL